MHPPTTIRALKQDRVLELQWPGGPLARVPFKTVRDHCPCASCIDEHTGQKILDPATIPEDIVPTAMEFVGNYALKIVWSDRHANGLYTWELLEKLARDSHSAKIDPV